MPATVRCAVRGCSATIELRLSNEVMGRSYADGGPFDPPIPIAQRVRTGWRFHMDVYFCPDHTEAPAVINAARAKHAVRLAEVRRVAGEEWLVANPCPDYDWQQSWPLDPNETESR
jgi:hypothetical protein